MNTTTCSDNNKPRRLIMNKSTTIKVVANWKTVTLFVLLVLTFTGCGPTRIPVKVDRPSTLNTTGIKRIAVMPFEVDNPGYGQLASYATAEAANKIRETGRFTLVDASEIQRLQRSNQSVENYVDAMFIGRITRASVEQDSKTYPVKDKNGNVVGYSTTYTTKVEVEFNYSLKMARDGRLIGPVSRKGATGQSSGDGYPSHEKLWRDVIVSQMAFLHQDIAPYTSTELREFAEDKTGVSGIKDEMKAALENVKASNYKLALQSYLGIYERYKSIAAAENASIMYEALGDMESALSIIQKVYDETGNPKLQFRIAVLSKNLEDKAKLAATEQEETKSPVDRVTAFASEEIQKVLPSETVVWLYNNSPGNTMVEAVVDNLTAGFIRKGINLVDRQNAALIAEEQKLQGSGAVSDAEMVRIGNAAGAKTIAIIGITGSGAMRRLQVRVLDIERGVPIMQSDTDEKWQM